MTYPNYPRRHRLLDNRKQAELLAATAPEDPANAAPPRLVGSPKGPPVVFRK